MRELATGEMNEKFIGKDDKDDDQFTREQEKN